VSTGEAINKLVAARLAADVLDVPTVIIARTDADAADLLLSDHDPRDAAFCHRRTLERGVSFTSALAWTKPSPAALAYAPYCDLILVRKHPSPIFLKRAASRMKSTRNSRVSYWPTIARHRSIGRPNLNQAGHEKIGAKKLAAMGLSIPVHHARRLARAEFIHVRTGIRVPRKTACWDTRSCRQREFGQEGAGYRAAKHQAFVGTGYFDAVQTAISAGAHSTGAMAGSTEAEQFHGASRESWAAARDDGHSERE